MRAKRAAAVVVALATMLVVGAGPLSAATRVDRTPQVAAQLDDAKPRNVVVLLLDGFDHQLLTAARDYELGADGRFSLDGLPFWGNMTTHGLLPGLGPTYGINYVNDSAATASAWATGQKTIEGRISEGPSTALSVPGADLRSVMLDAKAAGKRTANISDVDLTDATPAAMGASINDRSCQGPQNMGACPAARKVNGGKGSIAEQLVDNGIDVLLGGGRARFTQNIDAGGTLLARATSTLGYREVTTKQALAGITSLDQGPVLGLFAGGYMATRFQPLVATASGSGSTSYRCQPNTRGDQPTLAEMTAKALELVDNPNGFFMQVESAQTDKAAHDANLCGSLGQVSEADKALDVLLEYQRTHPDTLIVVTSDHGHATQIVRPGEAKAYGTVQTADGDPLTVGYNTSSSSQWHTGTSVPIAAKGPQAANVTGTLDQTDLYTLLKGTLTRERTAEIEASLNADKPRNTVVLLLDGFDHQLMTAGRNYELGADGRFEFDKLPFWGQMTTHGLLPGTGPTYGINYVNDSAATASAWATGQKTIEGRISQGPSTSLNVPGADLRSVMLDAKAAGKRTANITDVDLTDATPAAMGASINNRSCQGPQDMGSCAAARKVNGGKGSIAEQLVDNGIDVLLGGGRARFTQNIDAGGTLLARATSTLGYREVTTKQALAGITSLDQGPVLGLFAGGYMATRFQPLVATASGSGSTSYRCQPNTRGDQPTLAEMTAKALELVDNPNGFFMQVESAQTDKAAHDANLCGSLGQVAEADKALEVLLEYQRTHPDTLIVVTSDHGHATQIVRPGESKVYGTVQTADGTSMRVGYGTSTSGQWHTGTEVPIAAKGPQAANVLGTLDQTELYQILKGLAPYGTDVEAPVTTASLSPAAGPGGWHPSSPVTVTLTATDENSGVARTEYRIDGGEWVTYSAPFTAVGLLEYRSVDSAGNVEATRSRTIRIDVLAPTSTAQLDPADPGAGGTYTTPVRVTLTGTDTGGAGVDRVEYRFGPGPWSVYAGPFTVYTNGEHAIEFRAVDGAGNVEPAQTVRFTTSGLPGTPASCLAPSSDEFDGTTVDPNWTVRRPAPARYSVGDGQLSIRFDGTNSDLSGTTASATNLFLQPAPTGGPWTVTTKLDLTDAKAQSNQAGFVLWQSEGSGANRFAKITVNARTTDASAPSRPSWWLERQLTVASSTSGLGNGNAGYIAGAVPDTVFLRLVSSGGTVQTFRTLYSLDGVAWTEFMTPFTIDTSALPLQVGLGTFRGENNPNGFARFDWFRVCDFALDDTAPRSTAAVAPESGASGWHTSAPVTVTLGADDGAGTGVARTEYRLGDGPWTAYSTPLTLEQSATVEYRSTDVRGNVEPTQAVDVRIDTLAPVSTAELDGTGPVTLRLTATDAGSGVARLEFSTDGTWRTYAAPLVVSAPGTHTVRYRAVDVAGNVEGERSVTFTIADGTGDSAQAELDVIAAVVPGTLSLTLGGPATFGAFVPGVQREYTANTFLTATSSLHASELTVELGHMANGPMSLPEPLRADLSQSRWSGPIAEERVDVTFRQLVKATDRLFEGTYAQRVRFMLSAITP